ncbi:hypothetical protein H8E88_19395 [candidate division KSB1 bacterium]|nr:hypothetical protein [candidate division KSB1 bacterium]
MTESKKFIKNLILFVVLLLLINKSYAQPTTLYSWDFEMNGNAEGWKPTHSLSSFIVFNGTLNTSVTGSDPYMNGPGGLNINASYYKNIIIRLRVTHDVNAEFFWTTTTNPSFIAGLEFGFELKPDGNFMNMKSQWEILINGREPSPVFV